ncbi:MAG: FtsH protease activity modulator HflK [Candidatus Abyssobacteria bacterium SURF_17]|jgi:membrane protease subunit HflK|uniref:Protein HflK n=1 Tax=Candidatus Abyssobacteria bacterium SURF_17 TaxID=2093361 RepID=A0A419EPP3_9BACT|nr:MAG: FtsH protease activity modulator HflK [Candidatus Abyssubacteria bacterium SURF_17]
MNWKAEFSPEISMLTRIGRRLALCLVALLALAYLLSGIYGVGVNETGVLQRFGRIVDARIPPGLHYRVPWPMDRVVKVPTGEIHHLVAGFGADPEQVAEFERGYGPVNESGFGSFIIPYCITGDKNIIHLKLVAQYRITDPEKYVFGFKDAKSVAVRCIQSAIVRTISRSDVDSTLMTGRVILQKQILEDVQQQLSELGTGIAVFSTEMKNARPPATVAQAFKDVINAREECRTKVHDAQAHRNRIIPQGKAEASRMLNDAEAYKNRKIAHSRGESQRFEMLACEYLKDKETTGQRLYLEAASEILPVVNKVILGTNNGESIANVKFFTQEDVVGK